MTEFQVLMSNIEHAASAVLAYKDRCMNLAHSILKFNMEEKENDFVPFLEEVLKLFSNLQNRSYIATTWMEVDYKTFIRTLLEKWEILSKTAPEVIEDDGNDDEKFHILLSSILEEYGPLKLDESRVFNDEMMANLKSLQNFEPFNPIIPLRNIPADSLTFKPDKTSNLGRGRCGSVFSGTIRGISVAVKSIMVTDENCRELKNEASILQLHSFPGVVRMYGVDCAEKPTLMVMELAVCSLDSALHELKMDLSIAKRLSILLSCCGTFSFLHSIGIVHRDIKPMNILMMSDGNVKVTDFGQSKSRLNEPSNAFDQMGSPSYLAPELHLTDPPYFHSEATDMYSFAIMMNEVMTGERPYENTEAIVINMLRSEGTIRPVLFDEEPLSIADLITSCWDSDSAKRLSFWALCGRLNIVHEAFPLSSVQTGPVHHIEDVFLASSFLSGFYTGDMLGNMRHGKGTLRCLNGVVYEGEWENNRLNGVGSLYANNGSSYSGNFKNSIRKGLGVFKFTSEDIVGSFDGNFVDDMPTSGKLKCDEGVFDGQFNGVKRGVIELITGDKAIGEWNSNGDGHGTIQFISGSLYEGRMKYGRPEGQGVFKLMNGNVYEGNFANGWLEGRGEMKYLNGDVYSGEWKSNTKHGTGVMKYFNGDVYSGGWKNNKKFGHGEYKFVSGTVHVGLWNDRREGHGISTFSDGTVYDGEWKNDMKNGAGKIKFANGDEYVGQWKNNDKEGHGCMKYHYGSFYDGEWKNDMKHGAGKIKFANGDEYVGQWKNNDKEGHGCMKYHYGSFYDGEWKNDMKHGLGTMKFSNGHVYEGDWKNNTLDGYGVLKHSDIVVYAGEWKNGRKEGRGLFNFPDGAVYDGECKNDKKNGHGEMKYPDGTVYEGEWVDDVKQGHGIMRYSNGNVYDGDWKNNDQEGSGWMKYADGDEYNGEWKGDKKEGNGVMKFSTGDVYEGEWKLDLRQGTGVMIYTNCNEYRGGWHGNKQEGHGIFKFAGGVYSGYWKNGDMEGSGVLELDTGELYDGEWKKGRFFGHGKLTTDGSVYEGQWFNDVLVDSEEERLVHYGVSCDGCDKNPLTGPRYNEASTGFDLCLQCFNKTANLAMVKITWDAQSQKMIQLIRTKDGTVVHDWP